MIPLRDNIRSVRLPVVNTAIILACVVVFGYQIVIGPQASMGQAFQPIYLASLTMFKEGGVRLVFGSLILSMFMHGGVFHIAGNMLFLWVFGDNVEDRMGHLRYLVFYLLCGVLATLTHSVIAIAGTPLTGTGALAIPMVGASGAIAGVLGAYYFLFKRAYVRALVPIFFIPVIMDVPAGLFIIVWFIMQVALSVRSLGMTTQVAFWAHIGGFLAGLYLVRLFARRPRPPRPRVIDMRSIE